MASYNLSIPPFDESMIRFVNNPEKSGHQKAPENARTTSKKCKRNRKNYTIHEKLIDVYLEHAEKRTVQQGPFMNCNFLEELVEKRKLKYLTIAIYPKGQCFIYVMDEDNDVPQCIGSFEKNERKGLVDAIDNQEIPSYLFELIQERPYLLYDYHLILRIQQFATKEENKRLVFSTFLLLKPTASMCRRFCKNKHEDHDSTVFFEMAGPLYLEQKDKRALQLILLSEYYSRPFASDKLKINSTVKHEEKSILPVKRDFQNFTPGMNNILNKKLTVMPINPYRSKEILRSVLSKREMLSNDSDEDDDSDEDSNSDANLVEIFYFETGNDSHTKEVRRLFTLNVYLKNDMFYTYIKYGNYIPSPYDSKILKLAGTKEELDRYIFTVAETTSGRFLKSMKIRHKNMKEKQIKDIFVSSAPFEDLANVKSVNLNNGSSNENQSQIPRSEDNNNSSESRLIPQSSSMNVGASTSSAEPDDF